MASEKRCLYEILGLSRECSPDEIRSAYKKLALQRHPDKLIQTGISEEEATASFQELVNAYEVLSDPRERAWYDSHRSQILFADASSSSSGRSSSVPDLFSFFSNSAYSGFTDTGKGFYKVYGDLFGKIYAQELNFARKLGLGVNAVRDAPLMGNLESPYSQVSAFYGYWLGFCTVMDFCWVDEYDAMAGPNRKSRRLMEEENKKLRKKAKKEYNEEARRLAEFVKKRDKRVIEMQMKKNLEEEKRKEEEKARKKEAERAKLEKARLYTEPEWAKVNDDVIENGFEEEEDDDEKDDNNNKKSNRELYCVVCSKKFKSDKQWKNHEQSKKHREKLAELKDSFEAEDEALEELVMGDVVVDEIHEGIDRNIVEEVEDDMDELLEQFEGGFSIHDEGNVVEDPLSDEVILVNDVDDEDETSDEETSILKAMVSGHKSGKKKNAASVHPAKAESTANESHGSTDDVEKDFMEYDTRKSTRRNKGSKRNGAKNSYREPTRPEADGVAEEGLSISSGNDSRVSEDNGHDSSTLQSHTSREDGPNDLGDQSMNKNAKVQRNPTDKKGTENRAPSTKPKITRKGKKEKAGSRTTGHLCETCGENFDSRNKLHRHLGETGHATLKSR